MNFFGLGAPELLVIAFLLLLFFGKDRLPDLAKGLGKSIRELRDGLREGEAAAKSEEKPSDKQ